MPLSLASAVTVAGVIVSLSALLLWLRLRLYRADAGVLEDDAQFDLEVYEPMSRLLAEEEFRFLEAQPGARPEISAKLRAARRDVFRLYLRDLAHDFHRLHAAARALVTESPAEHSDLVGLLIRQQVTFWALLMGVEMRLALAPLGFIKVDARALLGSFEGMRAALAQAGLPAAA